MHPTVHHTGDGMECCKLWTPKSGISVSRRNVFCIVQGKANSVVKFCLSCYMLSIFFKVNIRMKLSIHVICEYIVLDPGCILQLEHTGEKYHGYYQLTEGISPISHPYSLEWLVGAEASKIWWRYNLFCHGDLDVLLMRPYYVEELQHVAFDEAWCSFLALSLLLLIEN